MLSKPLHKLFLNTHSWSAQRRVVGRNNELNRLTRILRNTEGSTTLVSGDRGSGKTTTIRKAVEVVGKMRYAERTKKLYGLARMWAWARINTVSVDIPLLPSTIEKSDIRTAILRLIVQALISDWNAKSVWKRMRMPLTYSTSISDLEYTLKYKRVTRRSAQSAQVKHKALKVNASNDVEYELNLKYADIELKLKDVFLRYARSLDFIVIFDELDKYESDSEIDLKPHDYIKELKNLFTLSSAKFVFTSTENYFREVDDKSKSNQLKLEDYKFSLFTHKLLINQLYPSEFNDYFEGFFIDLGTKEIRLKEFTKLKYYVMWSSNLYPFAAKKMLFELATPAENDALYIDLESVDRDFANDGSDVLIYQYLLNMVYQNFLSEKNANFDRLLYLSLKKVLQVLYSGYEVYVNKSNLYYLIFADLEFIDITASQAFSQTEYHSNISAPLLDENASWEGRIDELGNTQKNTINDAIDDLVWIMDSLYLLSVEQVQDSISMITISALNIGMSDIDEIQGMIETIEEDVAKQRLKRTQKRRLLESRIYNSGIDLELPVVLSEKSSEGRAASGTRFTSGWDLPSLINEDIDKLENALQESYKAMSNKFIADLSKQFAKYKITQRASNGFRNEYFEFGVKRVLIKSNISEEEIRREISIGNFDKLIVLNAAKKVRNPKKVKYFDVSSRSFVDYASKLQEITSYITKQYIDV